MFRELKEDDKEAFISMVKEFYISDAVLHTIPESNIINTFQEALSKSPYMKAYIVEHKKDMAGYGLISLTYSNEVGGLVVWLEELYIKDGYRGLGLGGEFLDFIKSKYSKRAKRFRLEISEANIGISELYRGKGYKTLDYIQMVQDPS